MSAVSPVYMYQNYTLNRAILNSELIHARLKNRMLWGRECNSASVIATNLSCADEIENHLKTLSVREHPTAVNNRKICFMF